MVAALGVTWCAGATGAGAASSDQLRKQAAAIQDQIEATDLQIGALTGRLELAQARQDEAQAKVAAAEQRIEETRREIARIRDLIRKNGAALYRRSSTGNTIDQFEVGNIEELSRRREYAKVMARRDNRLFNQLATAKADLTRQKEDAQNARDAAAAEGAVIESAKAKVEKARADQQAILGHVQGELIAALAQERAAREAAARARFSTGPAGPVNSPDVGPPNGSASQAIAFARGVLGAPYSKNPRFGPSYDCSGLTYSAWHAAGVEIPKVSGTQYAGLPHVSMNAIQPGDLIFWGPGGSQHVALYVGNGMIIDASSSQGKVVERAIWGSPSGAARVT